MQAAKLVLVTGYQLAADWQLRLTVAAAFTSQEE
jgi:hypothetical protein